MNGNNKKSPKIKSESELTASNLDPVNYFSRFLDLPETILNHLSGNDLLQLSEVSPLYYNFIASSQDLMKNIKILLSEERKIKKEDYDLLKTSSRKYQNIEIERRNGVWRPYLCNHDYISTSELDFILKRVHDWKNVSIIETYFRRKTDLWKFLSSIESSVESFSVRNGLRDDAFPFDYSEIESFKILKFPKLKHLKMNFCQFHSMGETFSKYFIKSVAIEKFEFECDDRHDQPIARGSVLTKMLENFVKLTNLTLDLRRSEIFEDEYWKRFQFKLKSLTINQDRVFKYWNLKFIQSQSDHLEELTISVGGYDKETFKAIMKMPKIKKLEIDYFLTKTEVPNEISSSITQLKVKYLSDVCSILFLLRSMPNVKRISFFTFSDIFGREAYQALLKMNREFKDVKIGNWIDVDRKELEEFLISNYK